MNPIAFQALALTGTIIGYVFAASAFLRFQRRKPVDGWTLLIAIFYVFMGSVSLLVFLDAMKVR